MSLTIVGTVAFDAIETPFGKTDKIIGGAGTYVALSASYFKKNTNLISVVGDDFPQDYLDMLKSHKINIQGIQIKKGEKTFFWSGKYHDNMNKRDTLLTELNSLADFDPVVPEAYQNSDYLMLGNLTPSIQRSVIERMHNRPKFVMMDTMNFWMDKTPEDLKKTVSMVDLLCINDEEAQQFSGENSLLAAAEVILSQGPKYLIIKKGKHGALLFDKENIFSVPALPLKTVFDPTGAGDTFAGGFIGWLAKTDDLSFENMKNALVIGSVMASFNIEKFGTERIQNLNKHEIAERIQKFIDLTSFEINPDNL
ncbi:MAG: PfkB family carbohydrate kinase [Bacteroidales bacterium]|nr:PfkB family carbohydrate kinase [Bacteroidales bacterium]